MERNMNTAYGRDPLWSSVSTLTFQTPEQAELTISHATLDAGHETALGPCTVDEAFTVILHLSPIDLFELHGSTGFLWSGPCTPGSANVVARPDSLMLKTSQRLEALVLGIPRLSLLRVAPEVRVKRSGNCKEAYDSYDEVGHGLGLALLAAFRTIADSRPPSTVHLARAMCYHFAFKYHWLQGKSADARQRGLAPWQASTAANLLERGDLQVHEVAAACQLSPGHFAKLFRITFQCTPQTWLVERRVDALKRLLLNADVSLADAAAQVGFADQASMSRSFRRVVGSSPGAWRMGQHEG
jgi:AraC family transcriptional regulator